MSTAADAAGLRYTPVDEIPATVARLRKAFLTHKTHSVAYRKNQLRSLAYCFQENADAFCKAINKDLGRSHFETTFAEVSGILNEIVEALHDIDGWAKDEKKWGGLQWATHGVILRKEPKGTVLVIGAWNYPITVQVGPMIGAIAAGNTLILKPSEVSAHSARLLTELLPKYLDPETFAVVNGGIPETTALLDQRFEHIFYTGNGTVGRIIQEKAAKWLCPVSLELGGKSPTIVDESADLKIAAHRILWGKTLNAGQTCISPDYVLVVRSVQDRLVKELQKAAAEFWPEKSNKTTKDFARIVNENHFKRLASVLDSTKGKVVIGGETEQSSKYIAPTVVANVGPDDALMQGELFGPILPIVPIANLTAAIEFINARDQPLALYVFGKDSVVQRVIQETRSGGVVVGDTLLHYAVGALPFGGTGPSGHGSYHGKHGFDVFSHQRAVLVAPHRGIMGKIVEAVMYFRYPPYTTANLNKYKAIAMPSLRFRKPENPHKRQPLKQVSPLSVWEVECMLTLLFTQSGGIARRLALIFALVALVLGARRQGLITAF